MARPLRIEFPGALYHVTSRGDRREPIFRDDVDRQALLAVVELALSRFDAQMLAYCLMDNHYHFVLHTRKANLSRIMRQINGIYTQAFNRRHSLSGHLFQGRFKAILVDRDAYVLEVCRYVDLNPVRAGMVEEAGAWPWSSFLAHTLQAAAPPWLDMDGLHAHLLGRTVQGLDARRLAAQRYADWVSQGRGVELWAQALNRQIYLGDDGFVERMQLLAPREATSDHAIPKPQRSHPRTLAGWMQLCESRAQALYCAHTRSGITMTALAAELGLSVARVGQLVRSAEMAHERGEWVS